MVPFHCLFSLELFELPEPPRTPPQGWNTFPRIPLRVDAPASESFYFQRSKRKSECEIQSAWCDGDSDISRVVFSFIPVYSCRPRRHFHQDENERAPGFSETGNHDGLLNCYWEFYLSRARFRICHVWNGNTGVVACESLLFWCTDSVNGFIPFAGRRISSVSSLPFQDFVRFDRSISRWLSGFITLTKLKMYSHSHTLPIKLSFTANF